MACGFVSDDGNKKLSFSYFNGSVVVDLNRVFKFSNINVVHLVFEKVQMVILCCLQRR